MGGGGNSTSEWWREVCVGRGTALVSGGGRCVCGGGGGNSTSEWWREVWGGGEQH